MNLKRLLWTGSLRRQLVVGVALVHAVLMSLLIFDVVRRERTVIREATEKQALSVAQAVAASSAPWVLSNDVEGLAEVVEGMRGYPGLRHVIVVSPALRVLGHTERARVGSFLTDDASVALAAVKDARVLSSGEEVVEAVAPVWGAEHRLLGWARVAVSHDLAHATVGATTRKGGLYALIAILAGVLFALALAWGLTRDLQHLANVSDSVRRGIPQRNDVRRDDELGRLAVNLNAMLDALEAQRRAGEQLREELAWSEARLSRALTAADEALWEHAVEPDTVTFLARGESGLGIDGERDRAGVTMSTSEWLRRVHPDDQVAVRLALSGATPEIRADMRLRNAAGEWVTFEARGAVERNSNGRLKRVVGTLIDVTAARALDLERQALTAQLQQSQKMDALGRVAGGVAHDFNNMLAAITARVEALRSESTTPVQRDDLDAVLEAARRAAGVTAQILSFSRGRAADTAPVDSAVVLREVKALITPTLAGRVLDVRVADDLHIAWVSAERSGLVQVLLNLCVNARDFHRGPNPIVLGFERTATACTCASCREQVDGEWLAFSVRNEGPVIDAATLERVFEPFYTTRRASGGSGLGLAVVHGLTHGWGGHVTLESGPTGTVFRVLLREAPPGRVSPVPAAPTKGDTRFRVLLVDDEPLVGRAIKRMLERHGFEVQFEELPTVALAALDKSDFTVVVSDYAMPVLNGVEFAQRARAAHPGLPIVVCSGDISQVPASPDVAAVQSKPIAFDELAQVLRTLAASSRA